MRRTGKRAFEPTMGSEGMSQLLITYSIFMTRGPHKIARSAARTEWPGAGERGVFSHEPPALRRACRAGARKTGTRRCPFEHQPHRFRLDPELGHDAGIAALHRDPVLYRAASTQVRRADPPREARANY